MARTTIQISGATFALGPAATQAVFITQTSLAGNTWQTAAIEATVTNGGTAPYYGKNVDIYFVFSDVNIATVANAPIVYQDTNYFSLITNSTANSVIIGNSGNTQVLGDYLYTWAVLPDNINIVVTLNLTVTQNS